MAGAMIIFGESVLVGRKLLPGTVSQAPVFHLSASAGGTDKTDRSFGQALAVYKADRGWQSETSGQDQASLTTFYFEWDRMEAGSLMQLAHHAPEVCNVASGLIFHGKRPTRTHIFPNGQILGFDATTFKTRQGMPVHVFKVAWLQGVGHLDLQRGYNRTERLRASFGRHMGQGRVLQGGIFGSGDENEAWLFFQDTILSQVRWSDSRVVE